MNNVNLKLPIIEGIYDIHPLIEPAASLFETALLFMLLTLLICMSIYIIWKYFYSRKAIAIRKTTQLRVDHSRNKINSHDAAYQLCQIMTQGLKLKHLGKYTLLPEKLKSKSEKWGVFINAISTLRYASNNGMKPEINSLFDDSLYWLKIWP